MSRLMTVSPQVLVANTIYDPTADDGATAFNKYNAHYHNTVVTADFLAYNLEIGDEVYIYNDEGSEIVHGPDAAVVDYITSRELRISGTVLETITNGFLYYKGPRGTDYSRVIAGISTSVNSQVITFTNSLDIQDAQQRPIDGMSGNTASSHITELSKITVGSLIVTKSNRKLYPVIPILGFRGWLVGMGVYAIDSIPTYRVVYGAPTVPLTVISQDYPPIYSQTVYHTLMYKDESIQAYSLSEYPSWRSEKALTPESTVYIEFDLQPTAGAHLNLSFVFNKVIYE